jgi:hypothetical protein
MPRSDRAPGATEIAAFEETYQDHRRERGRQRVAHWARAARERFRQGAPYEPMAVT